MQGWHVTSLDSDLGRFFPTRMTFNSCLQQTPLWYGQKDP